MKPWYQSKTVIANLILLGVAVLSLSELTAILPEGSLPYVLGVQSLLNLVLRFVTVGPVSVSGRG